MRRLRSYYSASTAYFLQQSDKKILGTIHTNEMSAETTIQQGKIWKNEIQVLKEQPRELGEGRIAFEYTIPGMGKRVDTPASERDSARPLR